MYTSSHFQKIKGRADLRFGKKDVHKVIKVKRTREEFKKKWVCSREFYRASYLLTYLLSSIPCDVICLVSSRPTSRRELVFNYCT